MHHTTHRGRLYIGGLVQRRDTDDLRRNGAIPTRTLPHRRAHADRIDRGASIHGISAADTDQLAQ